MAVVVRLEWRLRVNESLAVVAGTYAVKSAYALGPGSASAVAGADGASAGGTTGAAAAGAAAGACFRGFC